MCYELQRRLRISVKFKALTVPYIPHTTSVHTRVCLKSRNQNFPLKRTFIISESENGYKIENDTDCVDIGVCTSVIPGPWISFAYQRKFHIGQLMWFQILVVMCVSLCAL